MKLFNFFKKRPCDCDTCTGRVHTRPHDPRVSQGLYMWVDEDGKVHYKRKSSFRDIYGV